MRAALFRLFCRLPRQFFAGAVTSIPAFVVLFRGFFDLAPNCRMVALDLSQHLAGAAIGESMLFLIRSDEEHIAGEIIGMEWLWTWGGECFGYREGDYLWTYDGKHVGCFHDDELYAPDGSYLGEIKQGNRLVIDRSKYGRSKTQFKRSIDRLALPQCENCQPLTLYLGHKDFPLPDAF